MVDAGAMWDASPELHRAWPRRDAFVTAMAVSEHAQLCSDELDHQASAEFRLIPDGFDLLTRRE